MRYTICVITLILCTVPDEDELEGYEAKVRSASACVHTGDMDRISAVAKQLMTKADLEDRKAKVEVAIAGRRTCKVRYQIAQDAKSPGVDKAKRNLDIAVAEESVANKKLAATRLELTATEAGVKAADAAIAVANADLAVAQAVLKHARDRTPQAETALVRARDEQAQAILELALSRRDHANAKLTWARAESELTALEENLADRNLYVPDSFSYYFSDSLDHAEITLNPDYTILRNYLTARKDCAAASLKAVSEEALDTDARVGEANANLAVVRAEANAQRQPGANSKAALAEAVVRKRDARLASVRTHYQWAAADLARAQAELGVCLKEREFYRRRALSAQGTEIGERAESGIKSQDDSVRLAEKRVDEQSHLLETAKREFDKIRRLGRQR